MMPRTKLIAGNWKMNKDAEEAKELIAGILNEIDVADGPGSFGLSAFC